MRCSAYRGTSMDNIMKQSESLATMCHNQSMFLSECVANSVSAPRMPFEQEAKLYAYFRKQGTGKK